MNDDIKTKIRPDGLRYEAKSAGSNTFAGGGASTMSCVRCGRHMPRSRLERFQFAATPQYRCKGGCPPVTTP